MKSEHTEEIDRLVSLMLDGKLTAEQSRSLQESLESSSASRQRYLELLDNHEALCAIYPGEVFADNVPDLEASIPRVVTRHSSRALWIVAACGLAASMLIAVGFGGYFYGADSTGDSVLAALGPDASAETGVSKLNGHAMLRRSVDLNWPAGAAGYRDGDVLPGGVIEFETGVAEIDFFCGATLTIEGPAKLDIESDWAVRISRGRLQANVPPAARGFVVKAAESEIVDLGTVFSVDVKEDSARVAVIDGEVALRGGDQDGKHLVTGQHQILGQADSSDPFQAFDGSIGFQARHETAVQERLERWKVATGQVSRDERLIAHYPIALMQPGRTVTNAASTSESLDATLVGPVRETSGRFGSHSRGLDFGRIGARVRTRIEGEFTAFTFATWVRIDSLDHRYNALFMADGYENGEPHWQIRDDGKLMFSVMVDDQADVVIQNDFDPTPVKGAGKHRVYYTDPIWDLSKSGRWFHLAAVYDPRQRTVSQYVNGEPVSSEEITDEFYIDTLRIGAAEIGNWGQPFRKTPWFSVRNLNGTMDELVIFDAALTSDEIDALYENGKPLGY